MTTDDIPIREPDQIRQDCVRKLRIVQVSDHFQPILGCLLGEDWTTPRLIEMVITPDGHVLGRCDGDPSFKSFLGASEDLIKNIHGVAPVAEFDGDEIGYLVAKVAEIKRQRYRSRVMWIFTKYGLFSAVCARQCDGKHNQPVDPDRIMVRARMQTHLEALKKRFSDLLGDCEIQESAGTDYAFRLFVSKTNWVQVLARLAEETDYDNFKSEVANHQGTAGAAYEHSLHDVWSVMHKLQK